jgi:hypothetical protein
MSISVRNGLMLHFEPNSLSSHSVYHESVCPELRLSAKIGQFLRTAKEHNPGWPKKRDARHTFSVDGRRVAVTATKTNLPPWSPLQFSVRLLGTANSDVKG